MSDFEAPERALPRRDWILLPLVVVLTVLVFLGSSQLVASRIFAEQGDVGCRSTERPGPPRHTPNCESRYKLPEGSLLNYRFNECGFRSVAPCGPKPSGTLRIALMGTSVTLGLGVASDETFAARLQQDLSRTCSRPIEVENMGAMTRFNGLPDFAQDALALSPDVIVLTVLPFDLEQSAVTKRQSRRQSLGLIGRLTADWRDLSLEMRQISFVFAAQHTMLLNKQFLYKTYMNGAGSRGLMTVPPLPAGEQMYSGFDKILARLTAGLRGSGVPLIVMAVPNRVAAAMVSDHSTWPGNDPRQFGRIIGEIAVRNGALPLDVTPDFAGVPHAERLFFPVDNHPTGAGHAVIAQALANRLTDGSIPQLSACRAPQQESH